MPHLVLFLDDGGVMNDDRARSPQWRRLLGEFFPPRLGGTAEQWAAANAAAVACWSGEHTERLWQEAAGEYATFVRLAWLRAMCAYLGIPAPPEEVCVDLGEQAAAYVRPRVRAEIPGAAEAVRRLWRMGYPLYTASAGSSRELEDHLGTIGVRHCFKRLYGPDLVGILKAGPEYYARLFADAGVAPGEALVVDDRPAAAA